MEAFGPYHKIHSVYKRSEDGKRMLFGEYSQPEFEYLRGCQWVFTEKVDGTNIRIGWDGHEVQIGGKTEAAQIQAKLYAVLTTMFTVEKLRTVFPCAACQEDEEHTSVTLFGEGFGPKIQNGGKYCSEPSFVLFDVRVGAWWLRRQDVENIAARLSIGVCPVIGEGTLFDLTSLCARGFASHWGDFPAEGIVARPAVDLRTRAGARIITKLKLKDFPTREAA